MSDTPKRDALTTALKQRWPELKAAEIIAEIDKAGGRIYIGTDGYFWGNVPTHLIAEIREHADAVSQCIHRQNAVSEKHWPPSTAQTQIIQ